MKTLKLAFFAAMVFFITNATAQQTFVLTFAQDTHDFGDIEQDVPASHDFTFTNTASKPVMITKVNPSCGCTAPNYPKTPIMPGETAVITATYNAHNAGPFVKTLTVFTNDGDDTKVLYIKGKVIAKDAAQPAPVNNQPQQN